MSRFLRRALRQCMPLSRAREVREESSFITAHRRGHRRKKKRRQSSSTTQSLYSDTEMKMTTTKRTTQMAELGTTKDLSFMTSVSDKIVEIRSLKEFNFRVRQNWIATVVVFHADWCANCKLLEPRIRRVMFKLSRIKVQVARVNVDTQGEIYSQFKVGY